jgi:hypothetical protein
MNSGECISDTIITETGGYELEFEGEINPFETQQKTGGTGSVSFTHLGTNYTFEEFDMQYLQSPVSTAENNGTFSVVWIEQPTGFTTEFKFFGFYIPQSLSNGVHDAGDAGASAIFGVMEIAGQSVQVKCVKSVGKEDYIDFNNSDGTLIVDADGKFVDPAAIPTANDFVICEE